MKNTLVFIGEWTILASEIAAYQYIQSEISSKPRVLVILKSGSEIEGFCTMQTLDAILQAMKQER